MTPKEFTERCEAACAGLALLFGQAPDELFERGLENFAANLRDGLAERLEEDMAAERIAEIVEAMTADSRLRRREIRAFGLH
ncbi:hypothetical protein [Rhodoblastus sp.]|uniref:hypothetical protein n=1 Tax=Rhodoblastus sp. TaxID=1962975 RepID=UPI003F950C65